jgi:phosphate transport system substrate-binding protein
VPTHADRISSKESALSLSRLRVRTPATLALAGMLLAACGNGGGSPGGSAGDSGGNSGLAGEIFISGSSTVEPISSIVAGDFNAANPDVDYSVDGPGTGDGMALLCDGSIDIADASRPIEDEEAAICEENGVNYVELQIGIDGISVITSHDNTDVTCLSFADLYALTGPESQNVDTWDAANALADEIGSGEFGEVHTPFPSKSLEITAPGEESGTYDTYVGFVVADLAEARGADEATRPDYQASADDNVIIENIGGADGSLGWVGFAFADENSDTVTSLEVDGGDGCVAPNAETIASGEYPMSRPLFIYVNTDEAAERPELAAFVDYYLSDEGIAAVTEADYIALQPDVLEQTRSAWESR